MKLKKILVTPSVAKQYLEANINNRRVKQPVLIRYANDMKKGLWKQDTGEVIKVSKTGIILDGQHRLLAVILANVSIHLDFIFDLEDSVFDVIDTGASRTAADIFKIDGVKNANIIPSMIAFAHLLEIKKIGDSKRVRMTNAETLVKYNLDSEHWQKIARKTITWYQQFSRIIPPSWVGGFYAFFSTLDEKKSEEFINMLCTGNNITNNSINQLRQKLIQDKLSTKKTKKAIKIALFIKAWNLFVQGKELKQLKFDSEREAFPEALQF